MSVKVDSKLGLQITDTIKTASDLLAQAETELTVANDKLASQKTDAEAAAPLAEAAINKLAALVIDNEKLIDPADVSAFQEAVKTKHGMATILSDVVQVLANNRVTSKTAEAIGSPSNASDPYRESNHAAVNGFGSLPRKRSYM